MADCWNHPKRECWKVWKRYVINWLKAFKENIRFGGKIQLEMERMKKTFKPPCKILKKQIKKQIN